MAEYGNPGFVAPGAALVQGAAAGIPLGMDMRKQALEQQKFAEEKKQNEIKNKQAAATASMDLVQKFGKELGEEFMLSQTNTHVLPYLSLISGQPIQPLTKWDPVLDAAMKDMHGAIQKAAKMSPQDGQQLILAVGSRYHKEIFEKFKAQAEVLKTTASLNKPKGGGNPVQSIIAGLIKEYQTVGLEGMTPQNQSLIGKYIQHPMQSLALKTYMSSPRNMGKSSDEINEGAAAMLIKLQETIAKAPNAAAPDAAPAPAPGATPPPAAGGVKDAPKQGVSKYKTPEDVQNAYVNKEIEFEEAKKLLYQIDPIKFPN